MMILFSPSSPQVALDWWECNRREPACRISSCRRASAFPAAPARCMTAGSGACRDTMSHSMLQKVLHDHCRYRRWLKLIRKDVPAGSRDKIADIATSGGRVQIPRPGKGAAAACLGRLESLPHVQVGGRFVDHVHIRLLRRHHRDGKPLQLPAWLPQQHVSSQFSNPRSRVLETSVCLPLRRHRDGHCSPPPAEKKPWCSMKEPSVNVDACLQRRHHRHGKLQHLPTWTIQICTSLLIAGL